ncbi:UDP-N-acetylglucosamine 2-epimerase (hydrolyzing) [Agrobacterium rhizogenes]|jgi:UDP-N-acetylglucosamine 2-epimerase (hydrolysing)|nr:UDP-N-acetylglucosamine 2-epimerase (hydrolyzing) [Rhizobium rhizogenes]
MTGTRADWSKMKVPARAFLNTLPVLPPGSFLDVFITGMHMLPEYGLTKNEVLRLEGVQEFHEYDNHAQGPDQVDVAEETIKHLKGVIRDRRITDMLIHGDRVEAAACAMTARLLNVRVHHIEGGEITGSVDNDIRYAVTSLSAYHYVCTKRAEQLVIATGQPSDTVFNVGSPEMDAHARVGTLTLDAVKELQGIPFTGPFGIVSFHSVTTEQELMGYDAANLFATLENFARGNGKSVKPFLIIMPNNDPGTDAIRNIIEKILDSHSSDLFFRTANIPSEQFSVLQRNAALFIGNSSAGVREMPFHGVGSINVGSRQGRRAPDIQSIVNVAPNDIDGMLRTLIKLWGKRSERDMTFGDGHCEEKLTAIFKTPGHFERSVQKTLFFDS